MIPTNKEKQQMQLDSFKRMASVTDRVAKELKKQSEGEVKCPELTDKDTGGMYVDLLYCSSFGKGTGCKNLATCEAWRK